MPTTMTHIFEMFGRTKTVFNDLHTTSETVNGATGFLNGVNFAYLAAALERLSAILKSVSGVVKSLATISETVVAIVDNVKLVINAAKEVMRVVKEWRRQKTQRWWVLIFLLWDQALRWLEKRWHQEKHLRQETTAGDARWRWHQEKHLRQETTAGDARWRWLLLQA
ncbi:hypothetical protein MMC14_009272, partial [Varicellaria rhodocarpa]|nr:hypothetical protein [Varicellaria rhodocarpa]